MGTVAKGRFEIAGIGTGPTLPSAPRGNRLTLRDHYTQQPEPLDFVLPCLMAGTVASLYSPGGAGKSMLALQLAHLVAAGVDTLGITSCRGWENVPQGSVLYVSVEDGERLLAHRLRAMALAALFDRNEETLSRLERHLHVEDYTQRSIDLIESDEWAGWITDACSHYRLVILDTLRMVHRADENDGALMAVLMSRLGVAAAKSGAGILFLHHSNKNAALNGNGDAQQASRGSSVLIDNIRGSYFLTGMSEKDAEQARDPDLANLPIRDLGTRKLFSRFGISKANAGERWDDIWLRRGHSGILRVVDVAGGRKPVDEQSEKRGIHDNAGINIGTHANTPTWTPAKGVKPSGTSVGIHRDL